VTTSEFSICYEMILYFLNGSNIYKLWENSTQIDCPFHFIAMTIWFFGQNKVTNYSDCNVFNRLFFRPDLILKLYVFIPFLYELFPLRQGKLYQVKQEQWNGQSIWVEFSENITIWIISYFILTKKSYGHSNEHVERQCVQCYHLAT
jgi:hypothetical protein